MRQPFIHYKGFDLRQNLKEDVVHFKFSVGLRASAWSVLPDIPHQIVKVYSWAGDLDCDALGLIPVFEDDLLTENVTFFNPSFVKLNLIHAVKNELLLC